MNQAFLALFFLGLAVGGLMILTLDQTSGGLGVEPMGGIEILETPIRGFEREGFVETESPSTGESDGPPRVEEDPWAVPESGSEGEGRLARSVRRRADLRGYLTYRIQDGDTLRGIAERYLGDANQVGALLEHNPGIWDGRDAARGREIRIPLWLSSRR